MFNRKSNKIVLLVLFLVFAATCILYAERDKKNPTNDSEVVFIKKIVIKGNKRTTTEIIRERITIDEKQSYTLEDIIDEINRSRNNILSTGLFNDVFFDDVLDEYGNLELYVEVDEKNYFKLIPSGFVYVDKNKVHFHNSLFYEDVNFKGNKSKLKTKVSIYDAKGIEFGYSSSQLKDLWVEINLGYIDSAHYPDQYCYISPAIKYNISGGFNLGFGIEAGKMGNTYLGIESPLRINKNNKELKSSFSMDFVPQLLFNHNDSPGYLLKIDGKYQKELMLQITNLLYGEINLAGGIIPERKIITSRARGNDPFNYTGNFRFSITEEILMPLIFNYNIKIGLFFDGDIIGDTQSLNFGKVLVGGGFSFRWYHYILNPLYIDIALGKGVMLNFTTMF